MDTMQEKADFLKTLAIVKENLAHFDNKSYIKRTLSDNKISEIASFIEKNNAKELKYGDWPPVFLFVARHSIEELQSFENNLELVVNATKPENVSNVLSFLAAKYPYQWESGTFEILVKSRFLKEKGIKVDLDYPLPNKQNVDLRIERNGRSYFIECTVLMDSDDDRKAWDNFLEERKINEHAILVRPGKFDPPNSKDPSPSHDCLRFYAKFYDKAAKNLDYERTQLGDNNPNILFISFSAFLNQGTSSLGVGWALDELFADQPRTRIIPRESSSGIHDVSLSGFLEFTANELYGNSPLEHERYSNNFDKIISAPRRVGAVLLFERNKLEKSRMNYHANDLCRLSHKEIVYFEDLFK